MNTQQMTDQGIKPYKFKTPQDKLNYENAMAAKLNAKVLIITGPVGSGKTNIARDITGAYGENFSVGPFYKDETELHRFLLACKKDGHKTVCFDNVKSLVSSSVIDVYMINDKTTARKLGSNSSESFDNDMLLIFTMNNSGKISNDIMRRGPALIELE